MKTTYDPSFFKWASDSHICAMNTLRVLFEYFVPESFLDVGGWHGPWSKAFYDITGSSQYTLIDGDYVDTNNILVDKSNFIWFDLSKKLDLWCKYDLVNCLEVAEHLPETSADSLILSLISHGDVILFSAALPGQGGTHHVNEQYPKYWSDKFFSHGFVCLDFLRAVIWDDEQIQWWYRQNIMVFIKKTVYDSRMHPKLSDIVPVTKPLSLIHPWAWEEKTKRKKYFLF